ncbi:MAG: hypothetical protein KatS3mg025_0287 [Bacteroidia bacterium]|nr:MAG: hypothetical protein KatS3mg025_0287 [Bacteroidia bacterium]
MIRRLLPIGISYLLTACLHPIDVDVLADTGELVIEAYYNDLDSAVVKISRTAPYFGEARPSWVQDAEVVLEELSTGQRDTLRWQDSCYVRVGGTIRPTTGQTYRLWVRVEGELLYATSKLPPKVTLDTLFALWRPAQGPLPEGLRLIGAARDPGSQANAYRVRFWRNDTLQNRLQDWIYSDDRYIDGNFIVFEFPFEIQSGDTVAVELMTLPVEVVRFYDQLVRNAFGGSGGFTPPPDNAYSNFTGGKRRVWGYFVTYASDKRGLRVP